MANTDENTAAPAATPPIDANNGPTVSAGTYSVSVPAAAVAGAATSTVSSAGDGNVPEDGVDIPDDVCRAMVAYRKDNHSLRSLVVMSYGLSTVFNSDDHPWNTLKKKQWNSTNKQLVDEILRRWTDYAWENRLEERYPRPNQWTSAELMEHLMHHPITLEDDGSTTAAADAQFIKEE